MGVVNRMKRAVLSLLFILVLGAVAPGAHAAPTPAEALTCYVDAMARSRLPVTRTGIVFETLEGEQLLAHNAVSYFNPASVVKIATSATALERLGYDYRYPTEIYTNGVLDPLTGELRGDLVLVGSGDPAFTTENAFLVAQGLRARGVTQVSGNLVVRGPFYMNYSGNVLASARALRAALDSTTWTPATERAWLRTQTGARVFEGVPILGGVVAGDDLSLVGLTPLFTHRSMPLPRILKQLNNYSNNWMSHVVGARVGGAPGVEMALTTSFSIPLWALDLQTTSGLGNNDMRPVDVVALLRSLVPRLSAKGLAPWDILPVAGTDPGTLEDRFLEPDLAHCVVAKTGTLRGVSSLAGYMYTRDRGVVAFAILNEGGSPWAFRRTQDLLVREMLEACGGPAPVAYRRPGPSRELGALVEPSRARIPEAPRAEPVVATDN